MRASARDVYESTAELQPSITLETNLIKKGPLKYEYVLHFDVLISLDIFRCGTDKTTFKDIT